MFCLFSRNPKGSLSERLISRYASVSEDDLEASATNTVFRPLVQNRSGTRRNKSNHFNQLAKGLSEEELEAYKQRLTDVADLMSVFVDDEDDASSDQDDLIKELQDIGYIATPKHTDKNTDTNTDSVLGDDVFKKTVAATADTREKGSDNLKYSRNRMIRGRSRHSVNSVDW